MRTAECSQRAQARCWSEKGGRGDGALGSEGSRKEVRLAPSVEPSSTGGARESRVGWDVDELLKREKSDMGWAFKRKKVCLR